VTRRGLRSILFVALLLWTGLGTAASAAPSARLFDVPSSPAETALRRFARQADVQLIFDPDIVAGVRTRALIGRFDPAEALAAILTGTPLHVVRDPVTGAFAVGKKMALPVTEIDPRPVLPGEPNLPSAPHQPNHPMGNTTSSSLPRSRFLSRLATGLAALVAGSGLAQTTPPGPDESQDERVVLSPFTVTAEKPSRYQASDTTSGGRIRTNIMDSDAMIDVITKEFIEDIGATVILDAAKYSAGVSESNAPNALDRITVRGFQTDGQTVDGFYFLGASNFEPALIERLEIVKGPNAVLSPTGTPGGTVNIVTKQPSFKPSGRVSVQTGEYDANRVQFDQTGPLALGTLPLAYRIVAAAQDSEGPFDNFYRKSFLVSPSLTVRPFARTEITAQGEYYNWESLTYSGLPLDPSVGTNDRARIWDGLDENLGIYQPDEHRAEERSRLSLFGTTMLGEHLAIRVAGRALDAYVSNLQINNGLDVTGGSYNPFTGEWEGGVNWTGTIGNFVSSPAVQPSRTVARAGNYSTQDITRYDIQNDYVFDYDFRGAKSLTTFGFQYSYYHQVVLQRNVSRGSVNLDAVTPGWDVRYVAPPDPVDYRPINFASDAERNIRQYYAVERLMLLDKKLIVSVGGTWLSSFGSNHNLLLNTISTAPRKEANLNYGVVIRPTKNTSLFFAHSESALPITDFGAVSAGNAPSFTTGMQDEGGVRVQLNEGKIMVTASYFNISQDNYTVPNPANLTVPPPTIPFPSIYSTRIAKGWEVNLNAKLSDSLSVVGNVTRFTNRDPNNVRFRSTAEDSGAIHVRYAVNKGALHGFAVAVGADYLGKRPGDQAGGFARNSTPTNPIPNQPSFYLPARTLTNLYLTYDTKRSTYGVSVSNLFDEDYLTTSLNRNSVWPGFRRNIKVSYSYRY
jgi:iron complex outermembrane receptor protein